MKANYFLGNRQFELREEAVPAIGENDVLIKVAACGICGTDVHIYHGDKGSAAVHPPVQAQPMRPGAAGISITASISASWRPARARPRS